MITKSKKLLINTLRVLQCVAAVILLCLSLCAVFRDDRCDFYIRDGIKVEVHAGVTPLFSEIPSVINSWEFKLPKEMVPSEKMGTYDKLYDSLYAPSSFARFMKKTVTEYLGTLATLALVILVIGLIATGIKILIINNTESREL